LKETTKGEGEKERKRKGEEKTTQMCTYRKDKKKEKNCHLF
jgi:hypothetical protein